MTRPRTQSDYEVTTIVVLASLQQQAEAAAVHADPATGAGTFVPGARLRRAGDPTNTVVAYWARWHMLPGQRAAFASNMGGPMNVTPPGGKVDTTRDRWLFDSSGENGWTPAQVLAALGFDQPEERA